MGLTPATLTDFASLWIYHTTFDPTRMDAMVTLADVTCIFMLALACAQKSASPCTYSCRGRSPAYSRVYPLAYNDTKSSSIVNSWGPTQLASPGIIAVPISLYRQRTYPILNTRSSMGESESLIDVLNVAPSIFQSTFFQIRESSILEPKFIPHFDTYYSTAAKRPKVNPSMVSLLNMRGARLQQLMMVLIVLPTFLAGGYIQPFLGGIISYPTFYKMFPEIDTTRTTGAEKKHNSLIEGVVNASTNLGAVAGALSCMYVGNKLGRRRTACVGAIINIIGTVLFASSFSIGQLVVGRVVMGYGIGMTIATVPVWQAETSTTHKRGHNVIVCGIGTASGVAVSSWLTYAFSKVSSEATWVWRVPSYIYSLFTGIFALVILVFTYAFPESPRWLALQNRHEEARKVLAMVLDEPLDSEEVTRDLLAVVRANDEAAEDADVFSLFKMGKEKMLYRLLIACSSQWYSQMAGSALITYYSQQLFTTIGLSSDLSKVLGAAVLTWKALCSFISFYTIELAGRRLLFLISGAGMATCMFCLAICGSQVSPTDLGPAYAGVVFAFLFVAFYPVGFLGPNYVYSQEVIATRYRAPASGISIGVHWLTSFTVSLTTPLGFTAIGWKYYLIWGSSASFIIPMVLFLYPETTGLTMEEIDHVFIDSPSVLSTVGLARERVKLAKMRQATGDVERFDGVAKAEEDTLHIEKGH